MKRLLFLLLLFHTYNLHAQKCNAVSIYFKTNKRTLTEENIAEIKRVITATPPFKIAGVVIEGRSDTTGAAKANLVLSQKRIDATLRTLKPLLDKNIPIEIKNYGESNPISLTDQSKNRSVKITFILDTLVNLAKQGEGEIWLNTKLLRNIDSCNFTVEITPYPNRHNERYTSIPLAEKNGAYYHVTTFHNCFDVYVFPDSFYNPVTHIGRFDPPVFIAHCSNAADSMNFTYNADKMKHDPVSKSYYLIVDCTTPGGVCCGGVRHPCNSYVFVPEETMRHVTAFPYIDSYYKPDTIFVENERVWQDWGCVPSLIASLDTITPYVYSVAMFDSAYYYLKGNIAQYKRTDTAVFIFLGEEYRVQFRTQIYQLNREDYISFASPTEKRLFIKAKRGYVPGYYLEHSDVFIPFKHIRNRKYRGYLIDFPTEFGLLQKDKGKLLYESELKKKLKTKKTKTLLKVKPLNESL